MKIFLSIVLFITIVSSVQAEIKKTSIRDDKCGGFCFYWWPILPVIDGWHQDIEESYNFSANAQAPNGYTFSNAETVIYVKALYKPRMPKINTINKLINDDHNEFKSESGLIINEIKSITTADKQQLVTYSFYPQSKGNWEHVSYGEEGDFFLVFTISSRTKMGLEKNLSTYNDFITKYSEKE